jgi:hypothetical protein
MRARLRRTPDGPKKFVVVLEDSRQQHHTIRFGQLGASDYTIHKDYDRMLRYLHRHSYPEDWRGSKRPDGVVSTREDWDDPFHAGFWSRWLLWSRPTLREAKELITRKFGIRFQGR